MYNITECSGLDCVFDPLVITEIQITHQLLEECHLLLRHSYSVILHTSQLKSKLTQYSRVKVNCIKIIFTTTTFCCKASANHFHYYTWGTTKLPHSKLCQKTPLKHLFE